jgi:YHS domain-containing protein
MTPSQPARVQAASTDWAVCAYDGMHMKKAGMKATLERNGETLYFCTDQEKAAFEKAPERYWNKFTAGDLVGHFGALTREESASGMSGMSMGQGHHVFVVLHDAQGEPVGDAAVTATIGGKAIDLPYDTMMKHYAADNVDLPSGKALEIKLTVDRGGEKTVVPLAYTAG